MCEKNREIAGGVTYPSLQKLNWFIYKINKKGLCVTCSAIFADNESDVTLNYICVKLVFGDRLCNFCNSLYLDNVILIELVIIFSSHRYLSVNNIN